MDILDAALDSVGVNTEDLEETSKKLVDEAKENGLETYTKEDEANRAEKIFYGLTKADRDQAVVEFVVPEAYKDSSFDVDKIRENLRLQYRKSKGMYKVYRLSDYLQVCQEILSTIRMKKLPRRSYLIGAPNGFGKTSFVNECLITLRAHGFKVAPYITLWELSQIRVENEQRIMAPYKRYKEDNSGTYYLEPNVSTGYKKPQIVTGCYSFSEYVNADCLFVSFTDTISKEIESHALYQLLSIRGAKGLPTIVMMSTSLEPYENDKALKELVWNEIKAYDENKDCFDRVYHVSCYRRKCIGLENKGEEVDSDTGVVN